jgi:hypothetical protein
MKMTVDELIKKLENFPKNAEILIKVDYDSDFGVIYKTPNFVSVEKSFEGLSVFIEE